jgi:hypothetical protein
LDKATREELQHDIVTDELTQTFAYVVNHRDRVIKIGLAVLAVAAIIAGYVYYRDRSAVERQSALAVALRVRDAQIGTAPNAEDPRMYFATLADKQSALRAALLTVISKQGGSDEAAMAQYMLGVLSSDEGKGQEAEQHFKESEATGSGEYKAAARWALQEIYAGDGRSKEAEAILRSFVSSPTDLVSKEQATIELAKLLAKSDPNQARALVEPLSRSDRSAVQRNAQSILLMLPPVAVATPASPAKPGEKK